MEGRTEGRKAKNYVPPLFFEKAGDNKQGHKPAICNTFLLKIPKFNFLPSHEAEIRP